MKSSERYQEKTYAGLLGKNIGIRLGAPVEPTIWTYERIRRFYGEIKGYVKPFINFAADDDINGPFYFLRALDDAGIHEYLDPQAVGEAWLNYTREGVGMFWWGGYGVSTEHTAYLNLKHGLRPPESGSARVNGIDLSNQIGGQIFIDTWGFVWPGNPVKAAEFARSAASVSHDGEAVHGAAFIAACIAASYDCDDIGEIVRRSVQLLPETSTYRMVVESVWSFHREHPESWRRCMEYLIDEWGYDKYGGVCHVIPNAGVCVMALLYGKHLAQGVEIATMAGWDTDCNAGNVGSILGVMDGIAGIPDHYRSPINDGVVLSGISGYLNILDLPTYAKKLHALGRALSGEALSPLWREKEGEIHFDFSLPGSTHCFRVSDPFLCRLSHGDRQGKDGQGCLEVLFDRLVRGEKCKIYYKSFYRRHDFSDERYMPVFSPTAYPGQRVSCSIRVERMNGESITIHPYVHDSNRDRDVCIGGFVVRDEDWLDVSFQIPSLDGALVDEIGIILEGNSPPKSKDLGVLYLSDFSVSGPAEYSIDLSCQKKEFGSITGFSHNHGSWEIVEDRMQVLCLGHAEAMTGNYFGRDESIAGSLCLHNGSSALLSVRVQGAMRGYYGGFHEGNAVLAKTVGGKLEILASVPFAVEHERRYDCALSVRGEQLLLTIDGVESVSTSDASYGHGMVGYAVYADGRVSFGSPHINQDI